MTPPRPVASAWARERALAAIVEWSQREPTWTNEAFPGLVDYIAKALDDARGADALRLLAERDALWVTLRELEQRARDGLAKALERRGPGAAPPRF